MSTPMMNGGGQRPSEGVRKTLQFYGRLAAALAAGGVFAVLAYESPGAKREAKPIEAADRQGAVTDDNALPLLDQRGTQNETDDAFGLAHARTKDSSGMTDDSRREPSSREGGRSLTRADQDEELRRHTTAAPHSRAPPGG
jgi:hypothetical protein